MLVILGDRIVLLARELTKVHEELVKGPISRILLKNEEPRGEYTVVVSPAETPELDLPAPTSSELTLEFGRLIENREIGRREAIQRLATKYGLKARAVYSLIEEGLNSGR
jgi:16S rRNA (cytidine1402-2'-O)-methyltransferase